MKVISPNQQIIFSEEITKEKTFSFSANSTNNWIYDSTEEVYYITIHNEKIIDKQTVGLIYPSDEQTSSNIYLIEEFASCDQSKAS